ncbi:MAG: hypothetical protein ACYDHW_12790 [Syntrophorhabdaceae bacterium]
MWQEDLAAELKQAESAAVRKKVIEGYAQRTGFSSQHLYRIARQFGYESGRRRRSDKGTRKSGLTDRQVELVAGLIHVTAREVKGPIMPVERSMEIAADSGYIGADQLTPSGMRDILRRSQLNAASLKVADPHSRMRSLHPNHCHVFDVSVCIQYYLKGKKGLCIMDERAFYKNKLHNYAKIKARLLRYVIVDHFSGMFYFRYFEAAGETQNNLYTFLVEAWRGRDDARYPFRGVPFHMLMDNGAANSARAVVSFLKRLEVNIPAGKPYNSQRQGAVERMHSIIEVWFESGLRVQPAYDLETLNNWAFDFCIHHNATRAHTRHGMTRTQCWLLIKEEQLRDLPDAEILSELYSYTDEQFTRAVGRDYSISYKGEPYNLKHIDGIVPGVSTVRIVIKPFTPETIGVAFNDIVYEVKPIKTLPAELGAFPVNAAIIGEEFKAQPESTVQQAKKRIENMAYGEDRKKDQIPFEGLKVFGHQADKVDLTLMPRRGTPMEIDRSVTQKRISFMEFLKRLTGRVGAISKEQNQALREVFGDSIDLSRADEVIAQIEAEGNWNVNTGPNGGIQIANQ